MKELESKARIKNFKALKYEIRTNEEKKKIEDLVIDKMRKWKRKKWNIMEHMGKGFECTGKGFQCTRKGFKGTTRRKGFKGKRHKQTSYNPLF